MFALCSDQINLCFSERGPGMLSESRTCPHLPAAGIGVVATVGTTALAVAAASGLVASGADYMAGSGGYGFADNTISAGLGAASGLADHVVGAVGLLFDTYEFLSGPDCKPYP